LLTHKYVDKEKKSCFAADSDTGKTIPTPQ